MSWGVRRFQYFLGRSVAELRVFKKNVRIVQLAFVILSAAVFVPIEQWWKLPLLVVIWIFVEWLQEAETLLELAIYTNEVRDGNEENKTSG